MAAAPPIDDERTPIRRKSPGGLHGANRGPRPPASNHLSTSSLTSSLAKEVAEMKVALRYWLGPRALAPAPAGAGVGSAATAKTVKGTVGPGFTISVST